MKAHRLCDLADWLAAGQQQLFGGVDPRNHQIFHHAVAGLAPEFTAEIEFADITGLGDILQIIYIGIVFLDVLADGRKTWGERGRCFGLGCQQQTCDQVPQQLIGDEIRGC